jgi:ribosomal protein S18 acetylase RimI-like enzyme
MQQPRHNPPSPPARAIVIERARLRDLRVVARIQREAFRRGLAYSPFALGVLWLLPAATFLVARDPVTGEVLGNLITDRHRGNTRIINIAVARDARRQGIGRQLIRVLDERCPEGDLMLSVEADNTSAQRLYEQEGFIRTAMLRDYYGAGRHGYTMKKSRQQRPATLTAP